jgi:gliding motility-associated-like protein
MDRVWKVQNTGSVGNVIVAVDNIVSPCINNMLVSTDPAFPDNQTTVIPLASSAAYKYAAATLSSGQYFTFATDSLQLPQLTNAQACPGNSVTVTIQNPQSCASYNWYGSPIGGTPVATGTSVTINPFTADTTMYVSVVGPGNCTFDSRVPVTISLINVPAPVSNGASICPGNTTTLSISNPQANTTYNWYDAPTGGTLLTTGTAYTTPVLTATTTYYVQAVIPAGCSSAMTPVTVTVYPATAAPGVISPITICTGNTATLQVQPVTTGYTYAWYSTATGGTALGSGSSYTTPVLSANQTYYAEAVSSDGCISTARSPVQVIVNPPAAAPAVTSPVDICPGTSASLQVQNPQTGFTYQWYNNPGGLLLATGTTYNTPVLNIAATFYVTASSGPGCESAATAAVVNIWAPLTSPSVRVVDSNLNSITYTWNAVPGATGYLVSVDGINYIQPSSGATGTTHIVTGLSPSQYVTLWVMAMQTPACRNSLAGSATGRTWTYMSDVYVPTAFTPNNDGRNDILKVIGTTVKKLNFSIYNRWGERVFATTDIQQGWNGTYKGVQQPSGTFVFYLDAELIDGSRRVKKGSIMLIR